MKSNFLLYFLVIINLILTVTLAISYNKLFAEQKKLELLEIQSLNIQGFLVGEYFNAKETN